MPGQAQILLISVALLLPVVAAALLVSYNENAATAGVGIVQLMRRDKRGDHDIFGMPGSTFPPEYDIEDDNEEKKEGSSGETTEHTYYDMTVYSRDPDTFASTYVDVENWIHQGGAEGQPEHAHLADAYRKAAGVKLKFEFPFYGHRLQNLTIATGGFLYVGDQTHSWLAATQYIAPLMANFDTTDNSSRIQYADDGKRMIVEWQEVSLRDNRQAGPFTFQVHLWRNGNISFVYKEVPIPVANISDSHHPCKLGISDAYLFNHKVSTLTPSSAQQSKRVIHEYHRITIPSEKIGSNTVVLLKALPTCLDATTCDECIKTQLKQFKCTWCNPKDGAKARDGTTPAADTSAESNKPFCSDQLGLHRRRQEWIEGNCQLQDENQYCKAEESAENGTLSSTASPDPGLVPKLVSSTSEPVASTEQAATKPAEKAAERTQPSSADEGSGGIAFVTLFMLLGISACVWVAYAYFNPHTRSGQMLIKYRPSKWQIPSSHVRYSASVHM